MIQLNKIEQEGSEMESIRELFAEYQRELNENLCFQSFDDELKDPLKKYGPPGGLLILAYYEDEPVACIALQPIGDKEDAECEMKRLYVRPAYRKHGLGRLLVEALLESAKQKGYLKMKLDTLQRLQPAIALYKSYGFVFTRAYYENPIGDVVYMEKTI